MLDGLGIERVAEMSDKSMTDVLAETYLEIRGNEVGDEPNLISFDTRIKCVVGSLLSVGCCTSTAASYTGSEVVDLDSSANAQIRNGEGN